MRLKFLCRQVIFIDEQKQCHFFKMSFRWDGHFKLDSIPLLLDGAPFILLVDSKLPFRRQLSLSNKMSREMIEASGEGLFPVNEESLLFAMGEKADNSYLFAISQADMDEIVSIVGMPDAILVSDAGDAMVRAILNWHDKGALYEFNGEYKWLTPVKLLSSLLVVVVLGMFAWAFFQWNDYLEQNIQQEAKLVGEVKEKVAPLLIKKKAISHMRVLVEAKNKLTSLASDSQLSLILPILADIPEDSYVTEIKLAEGKVEVSGWGHGIDSWLERHQINKNNYEVNAFPKKEMFTLWVDPPKL